MKRGSQSHRRFTLRHTVGIVLAVLLGLPALAHATAFTASATMDLLASPFPRTSIAPITMNAGDTISLDLTFLGSEALTVDNSPFEAVTLVLGADSTPLNAQFVADYSLTLTGLSGEFLTSLPYMNASGGGFLAASVSSVFGNLTNSAFTFTGLHVDFTLTEANMPFIAERLDLVTSDPHHVLGSAVPEPATLLLLSLGLIPVGGAALRRRGQSRRCFTLRHMVGILLAVLLGLPAFADATAFSTSATLDLTNPPGPFIAITPITMNVGDTLSVGLSFAGSQALQIDNAAVEDIALFLFPADTGSGNNFTGAFSFTLTGLSGELLRSLPATATTNGGFLSPGITGNLTDSSFSFTGVHVDLTLTAATEPFTVDRLRLITSNPSSVVVSSVPEPATLLLLSLGLVPIGATALRRRRRSAASHQRFTLRHTVGIALAVLLGLPALAHATTFTESATIDLTAPKQLGSIAPIILNVGDTLSVDVGFAGAQALAIDHAASENVGLVLFQAGVTPGSSDFLETFSLTLTGLSGEFLASLPVTSTSSGSVLLAIMFGDLTSSSFTFTGMHLDLTLTNAPEPFTVDTLLLIHSDPSRVVMSSVPEPASLLLLSLALVPVGATALGRRSRSAGC